MKKSELKSLIKMTLTESYDWYLGEESTHEVKAGDRVRLINKGGYDNYQGTVTKIQMHGKSGPWADIKWDMPHHPCTTPMETKHLEVVMNEGDHPLPQDTHATDLNEFFGGEKDAIEIQTSKGLYKYWAVEDREDNNMKLFHYVKGPDGVEHYVDLNTYDIGWYKSDVVEKVKKWIESGMPNVRIRENNLQENKNTMKKSELKSLLKIIVQEAIAVKQQRLSEMGGSHPSAKGAEESDYDINDPKHPSYADRAADKEDEKHSARHDDIKEVKKLPVVKKPATPKKVGTLKEEIMSMIREALQTEMARVAGAVGSKFKVKDASSPTGWVVKGHKTIPDGTPTDAPKGPYVAKGMTGMGRPKSGTSPDSGDQATKASLVVSFDGDLLQFDFLNSNWPQAKKFIESEVMSQLGAASIDPSVKIGQSVYDKIEAAKELDIDNKLNASNNKIDLTFDATTKQLVAK